MTLPTRLLAQLLAPSLALAASLCSAAPIEDPIPDPIEQGNVTVKLVTVASGLTAPNWAVAAPGVLPSRMFVVDQP